MRVRILRITLGIIAAFQVALALGFLFAPAPFAASLGLAATPAWTAWMFAMFSARALGFAYGLVLAIRDPHRHRSWIVAMIGVQAIDWLVTVFFISTSAITLAQATTASFMPVIFIVALVACFPRNPAKALSGSGATEVLDTDARLASSVRHTA